MILLNLSLAIASIFTPVEREMISTEMLKIQAAQLRVERAQNEYLKANLALEGAAKQWESFIKELQLKHKKAPNCTINFEKEWVCPEEKLKEVK